MVMLLLKEKPEYCINCPAYDHFNHMCQASDVVRDVIPDNPAPKWCPLKELPKEFQVLPDSMNSYYTGWNAAIETIKQEDI